MLSRSALIKSFATILTIIIGMRASAFDTQWAVTKDNVQYVRTESNDKKGEYEVSAFGIVNPDVTSVNIHSSVTFPIPSEAGTDTTYQSFPVKYVGISFATANKNIKKVSIADGISIINFMAFADCSELQSVSIGNGCDSIGDGAFSKCTSLAELILPSSVTKLGSEICNGCTSLTKASLNGVTEISKNAFAKCKSLQSVSFNNAKIIRQYAFDGCSALSSVTIPGNVELIESRAFCDCENLIDLRFAPGSTLTLRSSAFFNCSIKSLNISRPIESSFAPFGIDHQCEAVLLGPEAAFKIIDDTRAAEPVFFAGFNNLHLISVNSITPLSITTLLFEDNIFANAVLEIPEGAMTAYRNNPYWSQFKDIKEVDMSNIKNVTSDPENMLTFHIEGSNIIITNSHKETRLYNLNGQLESFSQSGILPKPLPGVYVLKAGDKARQILIN